MTLYDSTQDTLEHIREVQRRLHNFAFFLVARGVLHDQSKLEPPEKEVFDRVTPQLKKVSYGSEIYEQQLMAEEMRSAVEHHYQGNRHHPEHFPEKGLEGMTLCDLLEMVCDWSAAVLRHEDGNIFESLEINEKRFGMAEQLKLIIRNSIIKGEI